MHARAMLPAPRFGSFSVSTSGAPGASSGTSGASSVAGAQRPSALTSHTSAEYRRASRRAPRSGAAAS